MYLLDCDDPFIAYIQVVLPNLTIVYFSYLGMCMLEYTQKAFAKSTVILLAYRQHQISTKVDAIHDMLITRIFLHHRLQLGSIRLTCNVLNVTDFYKYLTENSRKKETRRNPVVLELL